MTQLRYIGATDGQVNWGGNADPRGVLTEGEIYECIRVDVHSWHTKVFLKGFPKGFNSLNFEEVLP